MPKTETLSSDKQEEANAQKPYSFQLRRSYEAVLNKRLPKKARIFAGVACIGINAAANTIKKKRKKENK